MKSVRIGRRRVGLGEPVFVIAEAGVNHNGRLDLALKLIDAAAAAGADAVKFQTFKAEQVMTGAVRMAAYQKKNLGLEESYLEMARKLELDESWYPRLLRRAKEKNIIFMSAPHGGVESAEFLKKFDVPAYKIASGDLVNFPLLRHVAKYKKPLIISTGMADMSEVKEAVREIRHAGNRDVIVLQCTTDYPLAHEDVNLRAMSTMAKTIGAHVGFSDHTADIFPSVVAVALGATVIEKHLTLDTKMKGPDHAASLDPQKFAEMVRMIRDVPVLMGSSLKRPTASEKRLIKIVRKSVVTTRPVKKGEAFSKENLGVKRPGTGLHPREYFGLLGKKAKRDIGADVSITKRDI